MLTRKQARARLKKLGWSYRSVAPVLGVHHVHLALVLSDRKHRSSRRLLHKIAVLPPKPVTTSPQEAA